MAWQMGLSVGESFVEVLAQGPHTQIFRRGYLPHEGLAAFLNRFFTENPDIAPDKIYIASRFIQRLFRHRLGGRVAHLVTSGFEDWTKVRHPAVESRFSLRPIRLIPLHSDENVFGISERVGVDGTILQEPNLQELEFIASKLKMLEIEKVCINLLHANKNSANREILARYFAEKGLQVFITSADDIDNNEILRWRKNLLNAGVATTFEEMVAEIKKATSSRMPDKGLQFWTDEEGPISSIGNSYVNTIFGMSSAISRYVRTAHKDVPPILHLGLEEFLFFQTDIREAWKSPWGRVQVDIPEQIRLRIQPTLQISSNLTREMDYGQCELGFEPGPMTMGRGLKPCLFDILIAKELLPKLEPAALWTQTQGQKRFADSMRAFAKSSRQNGDVASALDSLLNLAVQLLSEEISLHSRKRRVLCTGALVQGLLPRLQEAAPHFQFDLHPHAAEFEALAVCGGPA
jgi:hypothetical protein